MTDLTLFDSSAELKYRTYLFDFDGTLVDSMPHYASLMLRILEENNVMATLEELKRRGADLYVLTASPHSVLDVCLQRLGLFDLFSNVWSCDDFHTTKADPRIYQMAAERIGKPVEEILFLDDNYHADRTAASAGMKVCGVYDPTSKEYVEDMKRVSDHYIYDFSELLTL